jgi:hypothetical protein
MAAAATIKAPAFRALNLDSAVAAAPELTEVPAEEVVVAAGAAVNRVVVAVVVNVAPLLVQTEV